MVELLDFNLLTKEEVDDMKIIAKKINASGTYVLFKLRKLCV
jgi:hypothetical protein